MKKDKTIIITGSASGLGNNISKLLKQNGYFIIGLDQKYFEDQEGPGNEYVDYRIPCDLSDLESIVNIAQEIVDKVNSIDVIINNACGFFLRRLGEELNLQELEKNTNINFNAPLILLNELKKSIEKSPSPLVINISSVSAYGSPFSSHYCMSKGALLSLTKAINEEFRIHGNIRAVSLVPGTIGAGHSLRESVLAITPIEGKDPIIDQIFVSKKILDIIKNCENYYEEEVIIKPHKKNIL